MGVDPMQPCVDQNDSEVWFGAIRGLFNNEFLHQTISDELLLILISKLHVQYTNNVIMFYVR